MLTTDHKLLEGVVKAAKQTAVASRLHIAVVIELYAENDDERFNYVPVEGLSTLYRPGWVALVGIAYPSGLYRTVNEVVYELERSGR